VSARGKYIVIEGSDGTGKSEQAKRITNRLSKQGIKCLEPPIEEPDGVPTAAELRKIIKNGHLERDPWTNVILFTAARRLNWLQAMKPALDRGEWVVASRSWISTVTYQGYGEGIAIEKIKSFTREQVSPEYMNPDLAIILTLEDETIRNSRISQRGELEHPDTFESKSSDFQTSMQMGYMRIAQDNNIKTIDASFSLDEVETAIWNEVKTLL